MKRTHEQMSTSAIPVVVDNVIPITSKITEVSQAGQPAITTFSVPSGLSTTQNVSPPSYMFPVKLELMPGTFISIDYRTTRVVTIRASPASVQQSEQSTTPNQLDDKPSVQSTAPQKVIVTVPSKNGQTTPTLNMS